MCSLIFLVPGLQVLAAEPEKEADLDTVMSSIAGNQGAVEVFLRSLSDKDLAHWSKASKFYSKLFKEELAERKNLALWAAKDLKKIKITCNDCVFYPDVVFSHDGQKLAAVANASGVSLIMVYDVQSQQRERLFRVAGPVDGLVFSPDGKNLALSNGVDRVLLFDLSEGKQLKDVKGMSMVFLQDGRLLTVMQEGWLVYWNIETGNIVRSLVLEEGGDIKKFLMRLMFSPDGQRLVGTTDTRFIAWECEKGKRSKDLPSRILSAVVFSPDSKILACKGAGFIKLFDVTTGKLLSAFEGRDFLSMAFFPGNRMLAISERSEGGKIRIQLINTYSAQIINDISDEVLIGSAGLAFSPDGQILAACSGNEIVLWYRGE